MTGEGNRRPAGETGLNCLAALARHYGTGIDAQQLRHRLGTGHGAISPGELVRLARTLRFKARAVTTDRPRLARTPLPAIAAARDGRYFVLLRITDDGAVVHDMSDPRPTTWPLERLDAEWDGRLVLIARRASLTEAAGHFGVSWFMGAIHKYRHLLTEVLIASFFLQLFGLVSPLFVQVVIDKVLVHRGLTTLDVLIVGLVAIAVFEAVLSGLQTYVFSHTTNRIDVELGARVFRHLLALPLPYFQTRRAGDSVARVRELENIRQFLTGSALTLTIDLFFTLVFMAVMLWYAPLLTAVVVAAFPVYVGLSAAVTPLFRQRLNEKFARGAENQSFLVESVTSMETLKAMAIEPQMQRRWEEQLAAYVSAGFRVLNLGNWSSQGVQLVSKLVSAGTLYLGAKLVIDGALTVGELVAFNMLAARVSQPVLRIAQLWQEFQQARLSVARLGDILNTTPEPAFNPSRAMPGAIRGHVTFDHVGFRYRPDGAEILHDLSLSVPAGQVVGIVGTSGSGKSTLVKLLQRLYVPSTGRVLVDGIDVSMTDTAWLRRQIGVVLQENVLFNRTIRDNIALADPGMPMERVAAAARMAEAHDFILELPEGYDTVVGERGASLSGGQRQRIAIARALVNNPRILILDEATSALDYESERAIQQNMRRIAEGRTVFIIAHRLSTVRHADRIVTLERGRLVEEGTHDELLRRGGRYAGLYKVQAGGLEVV